MLGLKSSTKMKFIIGILRYKRTQIYGTGLFTNLAMNKPILLAIKKFLIGGNISIHIKLEIQMAFQKVNVVFL
ncbi:hypothetical protein C4M50_19030 [Vibrio cholerae]|nr:hypothetical protein [Vibrio cholerae]